MREYIHESCCSVPRRDRGVGQSLRRGGMADLLGQILPLLAFWDATADSELHADPENPVDHPDKVLPIIVHWSKPLRSPKNPDSGFSKARQAAIEYASKVNEGIYLAVGHRWKWLPIWKEKGYIGSSGLGHGPISERLDDKDDDYALHQMDTKGRIIEMYIGRIESRLTGKHVATASGKTVFDFEVAEHLLIGLKARFPRWISLPFNDKRKVKQRSALLINRFADDKFPKGFPHVIAFDRNSGYATCWWIRKNGQSRGSYWSRKYKLRKEL